MKTSLGIWALGPMVTRFVPAGYQPEHNEPTAEKVHRAVERLDGNLVRSRHGDCFLTQFRPTSSGVPERLHLHSRDVPIIPTSYRRFRSANLPCLCFRNGENGTEIQEPEKEQFIPCGML